MSHDQEYLSALRHSCAHLLGSAVTHLYPDSKRSIGPSIENGFYYDFQFSTPLSDEDLPKIEAEMARILPSWTEMTHEEVTADQARERFAGNPYKIELIDEFSKEGQTLTIYKSGDFEDLCRGGHAENPSKEIGAFKLLNIAGAYWRGDEKNTMLTRIYGTCFSTKEELDAHLKMLEEAKLRDHRKIGKEQELFTIIDEIGPGLPLFYPKGALIRRTIEEYITRVQERLGYVPIWIPHITKSTLYERSGHLDKYDAMYAPMKIDDDDYYLKPMNCPHFMMLYKSLPHSYRDLPLRYVCTTSVYRYEKSGELSGLTRVRALTQDDCHVFCEPLKIKEEIKVMLDMIKEVYSAFGLNDFYVRISLRDPNKKEQYLGTDAVWETAEAALEEIVNATGWKSVKAEGEAAFYGPKLDFMFKDAIGRQWQLSTIQLDFNLPERFDLEYASSEGTKARPVVIHRAILGSTERFMGIMIEHYAGAFPVWLSPVQVEIVSVAESHIPIAQELAGMLKKEGIRVHVDDSNESVGYKVRNAAKSKAPYIIVIGEKEKDLISLSIRVRGEEAPLVTSVADFVARVKGECEVMGK